MYKMILVVILALTVFGCQSNIASNKPLAGIKSDNVLSANAKSKDPIKALYDWEYATTDEKF